MNTKEQIEELLDQLQSQTGIAFQIENSDISDEEVLVTLKNMLLANGNSTSKEGFLRGLLFGYFSKEEISEGIQKFHLQGEGFYLPLLIQVKQPISAMELSIFHQYFSSGADTLLQIQECQLALIRQLSSDMSDEDITDLVYEIQGVLEAETMTSIEVAYDGTVTSLYQLSDAFSKILTAMEVGSIFSNTNQIHWVHNLGMGKLIYQLSDEICEEYLSDHFKGLHISDIDDETLNTIYTFLDCGLSIAACARALYLHRNTLIYRLDKIEQLTGLDIRKFDDAMVCKTALLISTYLMR